MQTVTTLSVLRNSLAELRREMQTVALVPTMGALHGGHLALVRAARARADHVVVSIFINPRQFGPAEDLDAYPRQFARDSALLAAEGVALLWAPEPQEVYPDSYATNVSVAGVSEGLCGGDRPGHFDGVATVVLKLFNQIEPDLAFFGEKDWQQLAVIRRMARDLDLTRPSVDAIHGVPIVREADGLAMSSRNAYLTPEQRQDARAIPEVLAMARRMVRDGGHPWEHIHAIAKDELLMGGFNSVDYFEMRDADTLAPLAIDNGNSRLFVAARIGGTRLIDNMAVSGEQNG